MSGLPQADWAALLRLIPRGTAGVIVDAGANRGDATSEFAATYPEAHIVAVEPHPQAFIQLQNRFSELRNISCIHAALADSEKTAAFHVNHFDFTSSLFPRYHSGRRYYSSRDALHQVVDVSCRTLDALAAELGIQRIDFLKVDTQGAELMVFQGARRLLAAHRIDVIYTEFFVIPHYEHAPLFSDIWACLSAFGYSVYDIFLGAHAANGQLRYGDAIFVSPRYRTLVLDAAAPES